MEAESKQNFNTNSEDLTKENKKVREPDFIIHRMPKGYKSGRFDLVSNSKKSLSVLEEKNYEEKKHHSKKTGFLIIFFGVLVVIFLIYLIFSYLKTGSLSLKMPSFNTSFLTKKSREIEVKNDNQESPELLDDDAEKQLTENTASDPIIIEFDEDLDNNLNDTENESEQTDLDVKGENINTEDEGAENIISPIYFVDTDGDGLSDEEELIFSTSPINVDSDGDGYDDLTEILNLYNPTGAGDLLQNESIEKYNNSSFSYSVYYPKQFELKNLSDDSSAIFLINDQSFLQILVEKNEAKKSIEEWYMSRFFESVDPSLLINKNGWSGVYGTDFYSFYLTDDKKEYIYSIVYTFPENTAAVYSNIFKMMINSFKLN